MLGDLTVTVEDVHVRAGGARAPDYPGGVRPTAIVQITGRGVSGFGENVSFTAEVQRAFQDRAHGFVHRGIWRISDLARDGIEPFDRAAIEGALIDLGLRQRGTSLGEITGVTAADMRWVSSFEPCADPAERVRRLRASCGAREFKVDVDPSWTESAVDALSAEGDIMILDFKDRADQPACTRLEQVFAGALFEDPPPTCRAVRVALDRPLRTAEDVVSAVAAGFFVNLKAPRMGGFLEVLRALEALGARRDRAYFGGMFEVGPGREQARQLAGLFCSGAPNDLGSVAGGTPSSIGPPPARVALGFPGFGATCDWRAVLIGQFQVDGSAP